MAMTSSSWMTSSDPDTTKHSVSTLSPAWKMRSPGAQCVMSARMSLGQMDNTWKREIERERGREFGRRSRDEEGKRSRDQEVKSLIGAVDGHYISC
ncbi:hypothetical protein EYF80_030385 [Liparis tanakae]|uniref:Uncharacterized protein n=1 Tax=Liparis tanakae TaxID=230148 RepID=A0A4Z2H1P7_9TELE|nr:hypothetical protein EYF80_030385 [Liparis tanakae]